MGGTRPCTPASARGTGMELGGATCYAARGQTVVSVTTAHRPPDDATRIDGEPPGGHHFYSQRRTGTRSTAHGGIPRDAGVPYRVTLSKPLRGPGRQAWVLARSYLSEAGLREQLPKTGATGHGATSGAYHVPSLAQLGGRLFGGGCKFSKGSLHIEGVGLPEGGCYFLDNLRGVGICGNLCLRGPRFKPSAPGEVSHVRASPSRSSCRLLF